MKESYCNFHMFSIIPTLCFLNSIHLPLVTRVCRSWLLAFVWLFHLYYFIGCCGVLVVNIRSILLSFRRISWFFSWWHFLSHDSLMYSSISDFPPNLRIQESFGSRVFSSCLIFISVSEALSSGFLGHFITFSVREMRRIVTMLSISPLYHGCSELLLPT